MHGLAHRAILCFSEVPQWCVACKVLTRDEEEAVQAVLRSFSSLDIER